MYSINQIADAFLNIGAMSNEKLNFLCYYAQGIYMALNGDRLIDCTFEAWIHGPINNELFQKYKSYGKKFIPRVDGVSKEVKQDAYLKKFLLLVYDQYGTMKDEAIARGCRCEKPYRNARQGYKDYEPCRNEINERDMTLYFRQIYGGSDQTAQVGKTAHKDSEVIKIY